jgi:hypothetical protein
MLRWQAASGASLYTVCLRTVRGTCFWEIETADTQVRYPGQPPLLPETAYVLEVTADNRRSSAEASAQDPEFRMVDANLRTRLETAAAALRVGPLTDADRTFAIAQLYAENGVKADALEAIVELEQSGVNLPRLSLLAGDIYRQASLPVEAAAAYTHAAALAETTGMEDDEAAAEARMALGAVSLELGAIDKAVESYNSARDHFARLGDAGGVAQATQELEKLQ